MTLNLTLWITGLLLQAALIVALFLRDLVRRVPFFTLLIAFFLCRSVILYTLFGHIPRPTYATLYNALSLADLTLQFAVAAELAHLLLPPRPRRPSIFLPPIAALLLAFGTAALIARLVPTGAPVPLDRAILFISALMIFLFLWSLTLRADALLIRIPRLILAGLALSGAVGIAAQVGRTLASIHRNAHAFTIWAYAVAGAYLAVILFWLLTLRSTPRLHHFPSGPETVPPLLDQAPTP